jgi:hypothetical protein
VITAPTDRRAPSTAAAAAFGDPDLRSCCEAREQRL